MPRKFAILILILLAFNLNAQTSATQEFRYPKEINTPELRKLFDSTKWCMYCMICDMDVPFSKKSNMKEKMTYGQLSLLFDTLSIRRDTIEIDCKFYYKGLPVDKFVTELLPLWGKVFIQGKKRFVMYSSRSDARYYTKRDFDPMRTTDRGINPLQPEVKAYIIKNQNKIDPWFLEAAKKHHVLN